MKIVYNRFIPFGCFTAVTIGPWIFVNSKKKLSDKLFRHECIHVKQAQELGYIGFYIIYLIEFLIRVIIIRRMYKAYMNISFEQEAYDNETVDDYLDTRSKYSWMKYLFKSK